MSTVTRPPMPDFINWLRPRVNALQIVQQTAYAARLITALEAIVCDDTSATVATLCIHGPDAVANLPIGLLVLELDYDGTSDRAVVYRRWEELYARCNGPGQVFGIIDGTAGSGPVLAYDSTAVTELLAAAFGNARNVNTDPQLADVRTRRPAFTPSTRQRHREQRRATVNQDSAEAFVQAIDWAEPGRWVLRTAVAGGLRYSHVAIDRLTDESLWHALIWLVRNRLEIRELVCGATQTQQDVQRTPALLAAVWLRDRPVFRGLLKEALRRCLTFPPDVFDYFKRYVLDNQNTLDGYTPWSDPALRFQPEQLQGIAQLPDVPIEQQVRKALRSIQM